MRPKDEIYPQAGTSDRRIFSTIGMFSASVRYRVTCLLTATDARSSRYMGCYDLTICQ